MSDSSVAVATRGSLDLWSLVLGLAALFGVLMIGHASFEWLPGFDPAGWLRIVTGWMLPVGAIGAVILGVLSAMSRSGRALGIGGIVLAVVSVVIFIAMLVTHPY